MSEKFRMLSLTDLVFGRLSFSLSVLGLETLREAELPSSEDLRIARLKNRFAKIILKAQNNTLLEQVMVGYLNLKQRAKQDFELGGQIVDYGFGIVVVICITGKIINRYIILLLCPCPLCSFAFNLKHEYRVPSN